jgi:putative monooxygenase
MRHRFRNVGDVEARMVFHLGPLAPRPELGHVDTEDASGAEPAGPPDLAGARR